MLKRSQPNISLSLLKVCRDGVKKFNSTRFERAVALTKYFFAFLILILLHLNYIIAVYKVFNIHLSFSDCDDLRKIPHNSSTESKTKKQLFKDLQVGIHSFRDQYSHILQIYRHQNYKSLT